MRKFVVLTLAILIFLFSATLVAAHASLVRADPPPNTVLTVSPAAITLWFDEDLDPQFSSISVLDKNRTRVDLKNVKISNDRKQMTVGVAANLPPSAYTIAYRALSAIDGHITTGAFPIFIGAASVGQTAPFNPASTEATALPLPFEVALRWLNLLAALALCGALTLNLLLGDEGEPFAATRAATARRLRLWVIINLIVLFVGTMLAQLLQTAAASQQGIADVIAQNVWLTTLTSTRFGQAALARILLVDSLMVLFASRARDAERWRVKRLWNVRALDLIFFTMSALILLSFSLASHAASTNDPLRLSLIADWLHLLAIGAWTGGLFALTMVLRPALHALPEAARLPTAYIILRRFSNIAVASVALFTLTGLYAMWRQVGYANALVSTPYGETLIIKNLMVVPLLLMGAINTLLLRPDVVRWVQKTLPFSKKLLSRFAPLPQATVTAPLAVHSRSSGRSTKARRKKQTAALPPDHEAESAPAIVAPRILRYVRIEAMLGALVVLAAAAMTALPPARTAAPPPLPPPYQATRQAGDVNVSLKVEPYIVGNDTFEMKLTDSQGNPLPNVTRVNLRFTYVGTDLGTTNVEAKPVGNGVYQLEGGYLSVVGPWQVETVVRRKDVEEDLRVAYRLNAIDPYSNRTEELPTISTDVLIAILDLMGGVLLLIYSQRKHVIEGQWIGVGAIVLGMVLLIGFTVFAAPSAQRVSNNPVAVNEDTVTPPTPTATPMPAPSNVDAQALLVKSDAAMNQLRSLAEVQRFSDDTGRVVVTAAYQFLAPDKLRFTVSNSNESVAIGDTQYYREPGQPWEKQQRGTPVRWPNFDYAKTASQAKVEGQEVMDGEPSAVVTFKAPNVELYRHWIGLNTGWLRKQQMVAPGHNMLNTLSQFNTPLDIETPTENVISSATPQATPTPLPTPAPALDLLAQSDAAMNQLSSVIEVEVLGDDASNALTTTIHYLAPDRLRFKVSDGTESVAIRDTQYYLKPGQPWEKIIRAEPVRWPDFNHALFISPFKVEGKALLDGEWCIVLALKTGTMTYRFWIGEDTNWVRRWQMDGPNHHMLTTFSNFNAPLDIVAPP